MRSVRTVAAIGAAALTVGLAACSPPEGQSGQEDDGGGPAAEPGDVPTVPAEPVSLHILDVAGNLNLTQEMIDQFVEENPDIISEVTYEEAGSPDLVGTIKPQVDSGDLQIHLVLSGTDGMSAGIGEDLWVPVVEEFGDRLTGMDGYLEGAAAMQELAEGYGVLLTYTPSGPFLWYNPAEVEEAEVPATPEELLAWAEANPGRFGYARPANSGVGRTFLQALPYMLDDSDPLDPENGWDNTWDYLAELDRHVDFYTTGTGAMVSNVADGTWTMTPTTMGWDIQPRADGLVPAEIEAAEFEEYTFVADSQYALMPRGLTADEQSAILNLIEYMLQPEVNSYAYDSGYFYPGPAVEGASLDQAPQESQDLMAEFGRDWYDQAIEEHEVVTPLPADALVTAFDIWDREIGGDRVQEE
ncbi:ABC transporter substrate-binding protein [Georgenia alba]|uniref:ABC transporter substrate-binding protein n=1 Tax=Georgenia alba TaxID=2233858 RepID=A0ABW2Q7F0_9MICO